MKGGTMKLLKTIHGLFTDEKSYMLWCKAVGKTPQQTPQTKSHKDTITINNNYDVEKRERVNNEE